MNFPVAPSIFGRSTKRISTSAARSFDRKATERVRRETLATTSAARCARHSASASASFGRSLLRPLSTSTNSPTSMPRAAVEIAADRLALRLEAQARRALSASRNPQVAYEFAVRHRRNTFCNERCTKRYELRRRESRGIRGQRGSILASRASQRRAHGHAGGTVSRSRRLAAAPKHWCR